MPRKTKEETERTRVRILDTALELFQRQGYVRTTLEEIARKAGYTRGAIYWHYKNKQELLMMLAEEIEGEVQEEIHALFRSDPQNLQELLSMMHRYLLLFENNRRYRDLHEVLYFRTEWTDELEIFRRKDQQELGELLSFLAKTFGHLKRKGELWEGADPEEAAREICIFLTGTISLWLWNPELFSIRQDVPAMLDHAMEVYRKR